MKMTTRNERKNFFNEYEEMKRQLDAVKAGAGQEALTIIFSNEGHDFTPTELANMVGLPVGMLYSAVSKAAEKNHVEFAHGSINITKTFVELRPDGSVDADSRITVTRKQYYYCAH